MSVDHYENFPVASVLCPPALRPAIRAIYHFARTADDIADEGPAAADERLADLAAYRRELVAACQGLAPGARWHGVFEPLASCVREFALPPRLLHDLLDAFEQDVRHPAYADRAALLDYCRRSANPVGRLLLHLYGITDATALRQSDAVCSALQLVNFWQDLGVDGPRRRHYVPASDLQAHGVGIDELHTDFLGVPIRRAARPHRWPTRARSGAVAVRLVPCADAGGRPPGPARARTCGLGAEAGGAGRAAHS